MTNPKSHRPKGGTLLLLPGAFGPGGIEQYGRLLIETFARQGDAACLALLRNDGPSLGQNARNLAPVRIEGLGGSKRRFIGAALRNLRHLRPSLVIVGHVNFGPLALGVNALRPQLRFWMLAYGIEVWTRLDPLRRAALRRAERVLAISEFTRRHVIETQGVEPRRVELLPCALDPSWERDAHVAVPDPNPPVLLTVARLSAAERYKGVDAVLRALPRLRATFPSLRYDVIGDGDDRPRLEHLATTLGMTSHVRFHGRVSGEALRKAYAACTLFVMPSLREGFGIVFLEAAHFGKAVVAGRGGGAPEVVEDGVTGYLVGDSPDELALRLESLLSDPILRAALGANGRQRVLERYSFTVFDKLFRSFLAGSPKPFPDVALATGATPNSPSRA